MVVQIVCMHVRNMPISVIAAHRRGTQKGRKKEREKERKGREAACNKGMQQARRHDLGEPPGRARMEQSPSTKQPEQWPREIER